MEKHTREFIEFNLGNIEMYDDELIDNLRDKLVAGVPAHIIILSFYLCNKNCHTVARILSLGLKEFTLVRGNINMYPIEEDCPNHSWIESNGWVYDTTLGYKLKKDLYYELYSPTILERYDQDSIVQNKRYESFINQAKKPTKYERENLFMLLQGLEHLEKIKQTLNGKRLMGEIREYRENNQVDCNIPEHIMKKYLDEMEKDCLPNNQKK